MAKTKGPLLSLDAHGSLGDLLTYSHKGSGRQVRRYNKPLKPASAKQRGQRRLTEFLVAQWQNMSAPDKATWEANAAKSGLNLEGYHYFLREAQRNLYLHHGLVGYWHCNEIVDGKVLDLSGNALHGSLKPGYPANAPVLIDSEKTKFSKALRYDGVDEYVDMGHNDIFNFGTGPFTVSGLVYVDGSQQQKIIVSKWNYDAGVIGWLIWTLIDPDKVEFIVGDDVNQYSVAAAFTPNTWVYFDVVRNNTTITLYLNGVFVDNHTWKTFDIDVTKDLRLGCNFWGSDLLKGNIDEVCIYNRALSADEIATRYKFAMREVD